MHSFLLKEKCAYVFVIRIVVEAFFYFTLFHHCYSYLMDSYDGNRIVGISAQQKDSVGKALESDVFFPHKFHRL